MTEQDLMEMEDDVFEFLDNLWEPGVTIMCEAQHHIQDEFSLTRSEAHKMLVKWMETFAERHPQ